MGLRRSAALAALAMASVSSLVAADEAETYTVDAIPEYQREAELQLEIRPKGGDIIPLAYTVMPLTSDLGLNESKSVREKIQLSGKLTVADESNYANITGDDIIPYLCCDEVNNSNIQPSMVLNHLMSNSPQPVAILLYSLQGQGCGLKGDNLNFEHILTMPDRIAAEEISNVTTSSTGVPRAQISGNFSNSKDDDDDEDDDDDNGGSNSAVAMSILYSITGLITLLFLAIIATGAIRAHRYPERYGPRSGSGGRPRQSRAKGLARAVLETLPIVKFGDHQPVKTDPNMELENGSTETRSVDGKHGLSKDESARHLTAVPETPTWTPTGVAAGSLATSEGTRSTGNTGTNHADNEEGLGCSICTDDFTIGEDVRVLPCNHKYHPQCVDPWLVNVSGTCPLCRLDLRPKEEDEQSGQTDSDAPPLGPDAGDTNSTGRRARRLDLSGLRHAPIEERIEGLRRFRREQRAGSPASNDNDSHRRARLADRLRDRFRIRTSAAQSPS